MAERLTDEQVLTRMHMLYAGEALFMCIKEHGMPGDIDHKMLVAAVMAKAAEIVEASPPDAEALEKGRRIFEHAEKLVSLAENAIDGATDFMGGGWASAA